MIAFCFSELLREVFALREFDPKIKTISFEGKNSNEASPQTKIAVSLRRGDSRIANDLDWRL